MREYVELLFSAKLLKVVFATETLGVGINMPARTVVFTQLDKPATAADFRTLRRDEFWQMAGRSGRRGMDVEGFVVYYPLHACSSGETLRSVLLGALPTATSQLKLDPHLVLRSLCIGPSSVLTDASFKAETSRRRVVELEKALSHAPCSADDRGRVEAYAALLQKSNGESSFFIKPTPKQRKATESAIKAMRFVGIDALALELTRQKKLEAEIADERASCDDEWDASLAWLVREGYAVCDPTSTTIKGRASAQMSDGHPLIRGAVLAEGLLDDLDFVELTGWLACFTGCASLSSSPSTPMPPHMARSFELAEAHRVQLHDVRAVLAAWIASGLSLAAIDVDFAHRGGFVKAVLRVVAFVDELKPILLGMEKYELLNRLDGHQGRLMAGIVTNASLYTRF